MNIRSLFTPKLAEYIPGEKRIYKNLFGKTAKIIERKESSIQNINLDKISQFVGDLHKVGVKDKNAICIMNNLVKTGKPINATTYIVKDKNDMLKRVNVSLNSGNAVVRYKSEFKNGDIDFAYAISKIRK